MFALGHNAVEKSQANATRNQKQRSIGDLIGTYIRSAFPYKESPQELTTFFQGETDSVTFVSAYSQGMGGRGMAKIQIAADDDAQGRMLLKLEETTPVRIGDRRTPRDRATAWFCKTVSKNCAWLIWTRRRMKKPGKSAGTAGNGGSCRAPCG